MNQKEANKKPTIDPRTPDVLHEFNWPIKQKFPSFLEISLQFTNRSLEEIPRVHFSRAAWEKEKALFSFKENQVIYVDEIEEQY